MLIIKEQIWLNWKIAEAEYLLIPRMKENADRYFVLFKLMVPYFRIIDSIEVLRI